MTFAPDIISIAAVLVNLLLVLIAGFQLKGIKNSNSFRVIVELGQQIQERKAALDSVSIEIRVLKEANELDSKEAFRLFLKMDVAIEDYINSLEQLAFLILKKYLPESQAKDQYRVLFLDIVSRHKEIFGTESRYSSLKKLYEKWK